MKKTRPNFGWSATGPKRANDYSSFGFLIVDNEQGILEIVADALKTCGARHVFTASDVDQANEKLALNHDRCHAIISDFHMAPTNGLQFLKSVREGKVKNVDTEIPFVMITGYGDIPLVKKAKELGVDGFLAKPVSLDKLTTQINKVLGLTPPT